MNFAVKFVEDSITIYQDDGMLSDIDRSKKRELYQLYIFLLAKYDTTDESKLQQLLFPLLEDSFEEIDVDSQISAILQRCKDRVSGDTEKIDPFPFDLDFALSICNLYSRHRACVLLHALMGRYEEAVTRAMGVDVDLAQQIASRPYSMKEKTKLWRVIVSNALLGVSDTERNNVVLQILKDSGDILHIEDVLEYMSNIDDVDQFKDEICRTLESFGSKIEGKQTYSIPSSIFDNLKYRFFYHIVFI